MKIAERYIEQDNGDVIIHEQFDPNPTLDFAANLRNAGKTEFGESKIIGAVPMDMYFTWLKEAGVSPTDSAAAKEVLKKKLLDGEFSKFRVWEGTY